MLWRTSFLALLCSSIVGCKKLPDYTVMVGDSEKDPPISVEGNVRYNSAVQPDTRVFLVNGSLELVDESITNGTSYYFLKTEELGTYTILAGYENASLVLADVSEITLDAQGGRYILHIELAEVPGVSDEEDTAASPLQETATSACFCEAEIWRFSYVCCEDDTGADSCSWQWGSCS